MIQAGKRRHSAGSFVASLRRVGSVALGCSALALALNAQSVNGEHLVHLGQNAPGTVVSCTPKKSRICVLAISTAMPLVKPITMGSGT